MPRSGLVLLIAVVGSAAAVEVVSRLPIHTTTGPSNSPAICTPATAGQIGCRAQPKSRLGAGRQANLSPVCSGPSKLTTTGCVPLFSSNASIIADVAKYGLTSRASEVKFIAASGSITNLPSDPSKQYMEWGDFDKYGSRCALAPHTLARSALVLHAAFTQATFTFSCR
jgi:hypothetical protein